MTRIAGGPTFLDVAVSFEARDSRAAAFFWSDVLERRLVRIVNQWVLCGADSQITLRFVSAPDTSPPPPRLHLHLASSSADHQSALIDRSVTSGARHLDVGQRPEEGFVVLADPDDAAFCVIDPGNRFLAGCGLLAEVTCEGSRDVGLFWSEAVGWPLVWDQDGETAIQSPRGGTKISWGGPPVAPLLEPSRQRLHLTSTDLASDVRHLVEVGASRIRTAGADVELADPDGNLFWVSPSAS